MKENADIFNVENLTLIENTKDWENKRKKEESKTEKRGYITEWKSKICK